MRGHLAREGIEDPSFEYVVEPKVDGLAISLLYEDGLLVRGATRGNGEIGEDVTHNLRTVGSIPLSIEDAPRRVEVRGEIYMSLADFEQVNLKRARGGPLDVHEPAQLGGGRDPPARPADSRPSGRCRCGPTASACTEGLTFASHWEALEWLQRARLPRQPGRREARQRRRGDRALPRVGAAPRRARVRDRRRGREGRRLRAAAAARRRRARPALGDRVEVPADDGRHETDRGELERRQVRLAAPVRRAGAGARRRRDGQAGDAAQRGGPRAQGRAPRRRRDRAARRRRDPAGHLAGAARGRARGPRAGAAAAVGVPDLRHADVQAGRQRLHALPEPRLPGPPLAAADALRLARRDGHRRDRREAGLDADGAAAS